MGASRTPACALHADRSWVRGRPPGRQQRRRRYHLTSGARALQGLEPGRRDADHGVAAGQPGTAGRLPPERLGFDDLTELSVIRAVVPAIGINSHLLVQLPQHKW